MFVIFQINQVSKLKVHFLGRQSTKRQYKNDFVHKELPNWNDLRFENVLSHTQMSYHVYAKALLRTDIWANMVYTQHDWAGTSVSSVSKNNYNADLKQCPCRSTCSPAAAHKVSAVPLWRPNHCCEVDPGTQAHFNSIESPISSSLALPPGLTHVSKVPAFDCPPPDMRNIQMYSLACNNIPLNHQIS